MNSHEISEGNYINREISWIQFNERVLAQATDKRTPLLEQAKFSSIFSNNLDEFFMVRVASLKSQVDAGIIKKSEDGKTPIDQLIAIRKKIIPLLEEQQNHFELDLREKLYSEGICIINYNQLTNNEKNWINNYFKETIFPILTPLAVDPTHPFPFVSNLSLNIAAVVHEKETGQKEFARVKIPQRSLKRFIEIPIELSRQKRKAVFIGIPIEQVISNNLSQLFPGMEIKECYTFRVTRDADLELRDIEADDLMIAIEEGLQKRKLGGEVVRLEISENMPPNIKDLLMDGMAVSEEDLYRVKGLMGLDDLFSLSKLPFESLKFSEFKGSTSKPLISILRRDSSADPSKEEESKNIFSIIKKQDLLLHHPYDLFSTSIEEFINQAADDQRVMGIKMTLYRTSKDSPIIAALIRAADQGKQVMALVELKARFDEDNNIQWAKHLEQSGVHVVYGVMGLKTHTKIILVVRKEEDKLQSYVHIGTGNYNSKTSKLYTDIGLLSAREDLGEDLVLLFNYLTGFSKQQSFKKLLVAPITLRKQLERLICREMKHVQEGGEGHICAKMNSLVDPKIISLLYKASNAGVKIDLIVRGMCCLYPNKKGLSENIKVISIVGRFLEHSRIFWFSNNQKPEIFIGSADLMRRNLDRRVEAITPIEDTKLRKRLEKLLWRYLNDNRSAWEMKSNGEFIQRQPNGKTRCSQEDLIEQWKDELNK